MLRVDRWYMASSGVPVSIIRTKAQHNRHRNSLDSDGIGSISYDNLLRLHRFHLCLRLSRTWLCSRLTNTLLRISKHNLLALRQPTQQRRIVDGRPESIDQLLRFRSGEWEEGWRLRRIVYIKERGVLSAPKDTRE